MNYYYYYVIYININNIILKFLKLFNFNKRGEVFKIIALILNLIEILLIFICLLFNKKNFLLKL